ncbi:glycosyltransferase family 87 protein [Silicimonas sp. MF1-12-2]|uniref:glycosyltransferase family 87 protein n=1 Tax=Silicimonas sp. MF1-12-2 TaxID=3384793 RepID=UPI0039B3C7C3
MTGKNQSRDMAGAILLLVAWASWTVWRYWDSYAIDMAAIYIAGHFAWIGDTPMLYGGNAKSFAIANDPAWRGVLESHGITGHSGSHYVYPPLWAFAVAPFTGTFDPISFFNGARVLLVASLAASILIAWRLMRTPVSPVLFAGFAVLFVETTIPAAAALSLGQPQLLVIFLILLGFERYIAGRDTTAGVLLGLAAAIKVTPIILAVIFLADRRWRAAGATALTAASAAAISLAVAGVEPHAAFLRGVSWMESLMPIVGLNLTFETAAHDFFVPFLPCDPCSDPRMGLDTAWVSQFSRAILVVSVGFSIWITASMPFDDRARVRLLLISVASLFFGPLAWMHYYTLPLLIFLALSPNFGWRWATLASIPVWLGFSHLWMGKLLTEAKAFPFETFYPQHTALLSLAAIVATGMIFIRASSGTANRAPDTLNQPG